MKILVIGGSYFYGRVFVMQAAKKHDITVVNRGTYSMKDFGIKEIIGDRHNKSLWEGIPEDYDVVVDFCAYETGDIGLVLKHLPEKVKQYIFISTVDVYQRGSGEIKGEDTPLEERKIAGEAGIYIAGKVALEREIRLECEKRQIPATILRPAILYGPYNYAPRESVFIQMAVQNHILPQITDGGGKFQFVYVGDAAQAIEKCLLNDKTYGQAYNLCGEEILDYEIFFTELVKAAECQICRIPITLKEMEEKGLPLPFPATRQETEIYDNRKSKEELGMKYLEISEGIRRTYEAFAAVFGADETVE
ncbi:MAG: NAD-dependent epimerase/dehydratase family protein [Lachnospiraceae bacterium]|nr:NAD-dependent epimerase/dehydratase family protein [Lachnospiraceae bacterium]